ncbi:hypothetical protein D3C83_131020 [compost metagenome]
MVVGEFTCCNAAYKVVVLPLPVGPVTSTMPALRSTSAVKRSAMSGGIPSSAKDFRLDDWSSKRSTIASP